MRQSDLNDGRFHNPSDIKIQEVETLLGNENV